MRPVPLLLALLLLVPCAGDAVTIEWVVVGDPGNPPDDPANCIAADCGAVAAGFRIARYEVTNAEYAEFLNAKAAVADPFGLYDPAMTSSIYGGIERTGSPGPYVYTPKPGHADRPVTFVTYYDALRFANWLHNGQGNGDTETGAYTLLGGTETPSNGATVTRNPGARVFLPSENEWYKAAYYDPAAGAWRDYPTGSDVPPTCAAPTAAPNHANCSLAVAGTTDVGAYAGSPSPYGTFDQGGNVWEWNEQIVGGTSRGIRGGVWAAGSNLLVASQPHGAPPTFGYDGLGIRVASALPACDNGIDDDGDGRVDLDDPGCASADGVLENPRCQDGLDNDGQPGIDFDGGDALDIDPRDGFVDAAFNPAMPAVDAPDPQCATAWRNSEGACGLGAELALLLPLLRRWRARAPSAAAVRAAR